MATQPSESSPEPNKQEGQRYFVLPLLALLFQAIPPLLFWAIANAAYAAPPRLTQAGERFLSLLTLALSAGISLSLGTFGTYRLLTRARLAVALLLIVFCCLPALLGGAVYLHALLVFLTWI
ncbi:MAG: hypothetical protein JWN14_3815 [Chthonomonadales bacterium]|nr:hypothetical protein [Chthonomonadales bacterium]